MLIGHEGKLIEIPRARVNPMTEVEPDDTEDVIDRVLAHAGSRSSGYAIFTSGAQALQPEDEAVPFSADGDQFDREDRQALRRVAGLSTELEDVTEVEY